MVSSVADKIAATLVRHGVEFIFAQSNPTALLLAAEKAGIRQLLYRTENAAGAMSDAYSRVSNRIGVVAAQNGPAATLMVAPMAEALKASIPMLVIVQEVPASQRDRNAFQEFDHFALFEGVSKWTRRLDDPNRAAEYIDLAMTAANSGRPGPVVLLIAKDMLLESSKDSGPTSRVQNLGEFPLDRPRPQADRIMQAASILAAADRPVVIAGGGVLTAQASEELNRLVDLAALPTASTHMGKGAIAETHPFALGVAANLLGKNGPATNYGDLITHADVVLLIGTRTNENGTDAWTLTDPSATYIHIDVDGTEVGRNYESIRLVGDAKSALLDLTDALTDQDLTKRLTGADELKARISEGKATRAISLKEQLTSNSQPILPQRLMGDLNELITDRDIVVADASYSSVWMTGYLTARSPEQRFIAPRGLAGLGWGLPYAMGAKIARPDARVVAVVGDGGFGHVWGELEMAVRENIPVTVIILNNEQLVMQKHGEQLGFDETTTGIAFNAVDHAAVARAAGAIGVRITDPSEFAPALQAALSADCVTVLDVITSAEAYAPLRIFDDAETRFAKPIKSRPALKAQGRHENAL